MKDILLIGGGGGIGKAVSIYFAERGYRVFSCDICEAQAQHANIVSFQADIRSMKSLREAYEQIDKLSDGVDAVISLTGIYLMNSFIEIPQEQLAQILDVNLMGVYRVNKVFLPLVKKGGRIIITTSELAGQKPFPFNGIYSMTKTALDSYADALRLELQLIDIKVITIRPGAFDTELVRKTSEQMQQMCEKTALYKMGTKKFACIMESQTGSAKNPSILAKVFYKAVTAKRPRFTYTKNTSLLLKLYAVLPRRLQAFVIRRILK